MIKNSRQAGKKWRGFRGGNFLPASRFFCFVPARPASWRGGRLFFSRIFDKISSSVVVNILHDKTFFFFSDEIAGGRNGRPLRFERGIRFARRAAARLAILQNKVVVCDFNSVSFFASPDKKNFCFWFGCDIMKLRQTNQLLF